MDTWKKGMVIDGGTRGRWAFKKKTNCEEEKRKGRGGKGGRDGACAQCQRKPVIEEGFFRLHQE